MWQRTDAGPGDVVGGLNEVFPDGMPRHAGHGSEPRHL
ncbi:unnamed protein product [Spirodela intermedia]|uniref:Uncharacterized protein n=1 Tax=Spirodela intermedia TaxID=51605 RepID=A0A7I8KLY8_SPIIN|nr:unnamed protein product [Spirodela intermedia]